MSEYAVRAFTVGKVGKHPNADSLSITQAPNGYPVVFRTDGGPKQGDIAVHVPVDAIVDTSRPEFSWLSASADSTGRARVRAVRLRGVPSYGFLLSGVDVPAGAKPGDEVSLVLGVTKYEPGPVAVPGDHYSPSGTLASVPHYDIEGLRKFADKLVAGEDVWVSEKLHGSNGRWTFLDGQLHCGSRTRFWKSGLWTDMGEKYRLSQLLGAPENQGLVLYGEVIGPGVQDLGYGLVSPEVRFFDIYDTQSGRWYGVPAFQTFCTMHELPMVPTLYKGPFDRDKIVAMAEGVTTMPGATHVREGVVVKPMTERWDLEIGRVFLKLPGEGYLLRNK